MDAIRTRASFRLTNFSCSPAEITTLLGVEPTRSGEGGKPYVNTKGRVTSRQQLVSYWALWSTSEPAAPLEEHLLDLLERLGPVVPRLPQLPPGTQRSVCCSQIVGHAPAPIALCASVRASIAQLGAEFVLDITAEAAGLNINDF